MLIKMGELIVDVKKANDTFTNLSSWNSNVYFFQ